MSDISNEYDILFRKFYGDLFKFQTGKKNALHCKGCNSKKRFIINEDELIFSCGPKNSQDKKCGPQYTIKLPKYVKFSDLYKIYNENIHGSMEYKPNDISIYDLESLSLKMDVSKELNTQKELIKDSTEKLKRLIDDYIKSNELEGYIETLETLSEKRYKNAYEKRKIMKLLEDKELSAPEIIDLRKKYAVLVNESKEFIDMIIELRKPNTDFICIKSAECIHHDTKTNKSLKTEETEETQTIDDSSKLIDNIFKLFKKNDGKLMKTDYRKMTKSEGFKTLWGKTLFNSLQKGDHSWKRDLQNNFGSIIEPPVSRNPEYIILTRSWRRYLKLDDKYTYEEQVKILTEYYHKVDPAKSDEEIKSIINKRRPPGSELGTRIPTKLWLELCDKLYKKYTYHPLRIEKEKDMFLEEQEDGTMKLVYQLSPDSPKVLSSEETPNDSELSTKLYDPDIVFQFYSKSRDPEPGKGAGESIPDDKISEFKELSKIKNWRKMLSNFYESEFTLDDKRWLSVEHYYQGSKFKKENPEFYEKFSLDSDSDISKDPNLAKSAGGKSGKSKGKLIRPSNIKIDKDFFKNGRSSNEMKLAQMEKYKQNKELKKMLLLTKDAKLTHFSRGSPPIVFTETMEIRNELR